MVLTCPVLQSYQSLVCAKLNLVRLCIFVHAFSVSDRFSSIAVSAGAIITKAPVATSIPAKNGKTTRSLVLDGDYDFVVARFKDQFLRECTQKLSHNGARDVKCIDARPGPIIVDVSGSKRAVDAVIAEVTANGLDLPSFTKLSISGMCQVEPCPIVHFCTCVLGF